MSDVIKFLNKSKKYIETTDKIEFNKTIIVKYSNNTEQKRIIRIIINKKSLTKYNETLVKKFITNKLPHFEDEFKESKFLLMRLKASFVMIMPYVRYAGGNLFDVHGDDIEKEIYSEDANGNRFEKSKETDEWIVYSGLTKRQNKKID